jgi:amino acid adenylation domain-containing protein
MNFKEKRDLNELVIAANQNKKEKEFWLKKLSGGIEKSFFPYDYKRYVTETRVNTIKFKFHNQISQKLMELSNKSDLRLHAILTAGVVILLQKYTQKNDILMGLPIYKQEDDSQLINTVLTLRNQFDINFTFKELLIQVRETIVEASENYGYPIEILQEQLNESSTGSDFQLFDTAVLLENIHDENYLQHVELNMVFAFLRTHRYLEGEVKYNASLYRKSTIERIINHLINLFHEVLFNLELKISGINILSKDEKKQLLLDFNQTQREYPKDKTIQRLFREQVEKIPDCTAVVGEDQHLSYTELNRKAGSLAGILKSKGVKPGIIVGLMIERSLEMISAILGILKAGGAYLPIEVDMPENRVLSLLEDCRVSILLTGSRVTDNFSFTRVQELSVISSKPHLTPVRPQVKELDALPFPDRTLVDYQKYHRQIGVAMTKHTVTIMGSRGCPYHCAYCHKIWPKRHIRRSPENIFEEILACYKAGIRRIVFLDDIFNLDIKNSSRLFHLILKNKLDLHLFFPNGVRGDILTKDYIDLMVEAGTVNMMMPLETASPRLQKLIGKNLNLERFEENLEYIIEKYPDILLEMNIMQGFPTETEEEALMSLNFVKRRRWIHFPNMNIVKIYLNTDMERLALENGIAKESIERSTNIGYHELPETLPFPGNFTLKCQAELFNDYLLSKERLSKVIPYQMKLLAEDEFVQKYNSYLPITINRFTDFLDFVGISADQLKENRFLDAEAFAVPHFNENIKKYFPLQPGTAPEFKILFLDLSQLFSHEADMLYDVTEPPLGLMYLVSYLNRQMGGKIKGKIAKSRIDFDNYEELKQLLEEYKPDLIGIRTLTFFKNFFHKTVAVIRQQGVTVPIIAGGPYASADYQTILQDTNIDLAVRGEGEITITRLIEAIIENNGKLPPDETLEKIEGIAFIPRRHKQNKTHAREILLLDHLAGTSPKPNTTNLYEKNHPADLAYVIYTSGSTGKPKGVLTSHYNVIRVVKHTNYIDISRGDRILQLSNYAFDGSVFDIFGSLLNGAALVIIKKSDVINIDRLSQLIKKQGITVFFVTTALFNMIVELEIDSLKNVKKILFGGEKISLEHTRKALAYLGKERILHMYGPTETTVYATSYTINEIDRRASTIPIGKPIANTTVYLLDIRLKPVPIGVSGEVYIGGDATARGYLNNPDYTQKKFVKSPLLERERMYRSGDLARWLPDGNIEFLGRIDYQVKIRGFRIEPGEIESKLLGHQYLKEVVVMVYEEKSQGKFLCAYIVSEKEFEISELREYLSGDLPGYMIPAYFVRLDKIPLTSNGKVDRKALPNPNLSVRAGYVPPRDRLEEKLVEIWGEVLGIDKNIVGINDDFFELGGHSLKATILLANIHKELNLKISFSDLFTNVTIGRLSDFIKGLKLTKYDSLKAVEKKEYYALSSSQKRLYILHQIENINTSYNIPFVMRIEGDMAGRKLEETFKRLIARHESFRTSFKILEEQSVQVIHDDVEFSIEFCDIEKQMQAAEPGEMEPQEKIINRFVRPFDLEKAPLLRVGLVKLAEKNHLFMFDMHHIISDIISHKILKEEFATLYADKGLPGLRLQYKDFSEWQNSPEQQTLIKQQELYWINLLSGELPVLNLPTDFPRPSMQSFEGGFFRFTLNEELSKKLKDKVTKTGTTLYMFIVSVFTILLSKLSGQEDIIIGTPIAARRHADIKNIIGMFVNTLALRNQPQGEMTFSAYLAEIKVKTLNAFENQEYQFEDLVEKVLVNRDTSRNPLFDVMCVLQNTFDEPPGITTKKEENFKITSHPYECNISKFDLTLDAVERPGKLYFSFEYCTKLFRKETVLKFAQYFKNIIYRIIENLDSRLSRLEIITEEERRRVLKDFNNTPNTRGDYPYDKTIFQLVEEQVKRIPDHIAVVGHSPGGNEDRIQKMQYLSYKELNQRSNQLACLLRTKGVETDTNTIVGIMADRCVEMIIAILGILKAGGAYLPIDPDYPQERIDYMLKDSGTKILLSAGQHPDLPSSPLPSFSHLHLSSAPVTSLAYVIYTSGSTGMPKGVIVQHNNFVNASSSWREEYKLKEIEVNLLQIASFSFDVFAGDFARALTNGGKLVICPADVRVEPSSLYSLIKKQRITLFESTPALILPFMDYVYENQLDIHQLKLLIVGSDVFRIEDFTRLHSRFGNHMRIINSYGVTEATIDTSYYEKSVENIAATGNLPIGKPMLNMKFFVMDRHDNLQPIGIAGHLYISGRGVSRGYLNNPELTAEKFKRAVISHSSFVIGSSKKIYKSTNDQCPMTNDRLYKTGDLARWLPDGNVQLLGRIDYQVKIRGFRVELGEIESRLLKHFLIKEVVVVDRANEKGESELTAYFVAASAADKGPDAEELWEFLSRELPYYMIPSYFIPIREIPLSPNGKIDRRALPEPHIKRGEYYTAPRNEIERKLVELWFEVLFAENTSNPSTVISLTSIGIDDNFFNLGGHSLKAAILVSNIHRALHVRLPLAEIFRTPTIRGLAGYIIGKTKDKYTSIEPVEKKEHYPLSSAQKRLYFLQQMELNSTSYNMPMSFPLGKDTDKKKLEVVLKKLVARHESLRTSFITVADEPQCRIHEPDEVEFAIEYYDMEKVETKQGKQKEDKQNIFDLPALSSQNFVRPFDLSRVPLVRSGLLKHPDGYQTWLVDIHHIVSDGTSDTILTEDFMSLYNDEKLKPLRIQYRDFSQWQNQLLANGAIKAQEIYWMKLLADAAEIPRLQLPTDHERPKVFTFQGDSYRFILEQEETTKLKQLGAQQNSTLFMNILTALNTLFYKYTSQTDIIIGSVIAGRPHFDLQSIVGMFVNTLPMRNYPAGDKTYLVFLKEIIQNCLNAYENQDLQFEELVDKLNVERDPSRNPLFDVTLVVQNYTTFKSRARSITKGKLTSTSYKFVRLASQFDLSIDVFEVGDEIVFNLEYYTKLFKRETILRLKDHFINVIRQVVENPMIRLGEVDILNPEEKQRLLNEWNDTFREYPGAKTLHELFIQQVERIPHHTALVGKIPKGRAPAYNKTQIPNAIDENVSITYQELNQRSNRLAQYLFLKKQVRPDDRVGILMGRSLEMIIAMLGIVKAGSAYVPIAPDFPAERLKEIINNADIGVVISQKKYIRELNRLQWECQSFHTFLCMDTTDIYSEKEYDSVDITDREKIWEYVGESSADEITGGGWLSSYTGLPLSQEEMDEYGDNVLKKLTPLLHENMRVLEIGCASGITMYRIAPLVGFYYGTDLSAVIIRENLRRIEQQGHKNIALSCVHAHDIDQINEKEFDLVIINSVIQDFYGHNYLRQVIKKVIDLMGEIGYLFIGDIMDLELKENLIREMKEFKRTHQDKNYRTKTDFSSELFVFRAFFQDLCMEFPVIGSVKFSEKIYTIENELTKFRYDVLCKINKRGRQEKQYRKFRNKHKYQEDLLALAQFPTDEVTPDTGSTHLAYVMYTSGTTGKSKGIMIEHHSVVNLLNWFANAYHIKPGIQVMQLTEYTFDPSVEDIFGTLLYGGTLHVIDKETVLDREKFFHYVQRHQIHIINFIPTGLQQLLSHKKSDSLRAVICGGERLEVGVKDEIIKKGYPLFNHYGPTEITVDALVSTCKDIGEPVTIGRPITNIKCFVLDKNNHLAPVGIAGELCISGSGLSRGYLNNPALTAEKFKLDLFEHGEKYYQTGDFCRWLPDGNIHFLGRIDQQVKIRGYRIELGEIENQLLKHTDVREVVVEAIVKEPGDKYLCAYFVPKIGTLNDHTAPLSSLESLSKELMRYLSHSLPDYMIPSYFIQLDNIPLTSHGKIDRKSLAPPVVKPASGYTPPRHEIEIRLANIWSEVLGIEKAIINIDSNFFDLGGHSLKAVVLTSKIYKEFGITVPLVEIFQSPTIQALTRYIKDSRKILETAEDHKLLLLKKVASNAPNLFFIHDGTGEVNSYWEFCQYLDSGFNCWGIDADYVNGKFNSGNFTLEEVASRYLEKVKDLQPHGPYFIGGWSLGGNIAFEMTRQLEQKSEKIAFLAIIDSSPPIINVQKTIRKFNRESELKVVLKHFPGIKKYLKSVKINELDTITPLVVDYLEDHQIDIETVKTLIPGNMLQVIPNHDKIGIKELVGYWDVIRAFEEAMALYMPKEKINTPIHYFAAAQSGNGKKENWHNYCNKTPKVFEIPGDHFSILKPPKVVQLAKIFNKAIKACVTI